MTKRMMAATVMAVAFLVSGCWDSGEVTIHQAGEYKGVRDPLLAQDAAEREETLKERFALSQTDR